WLLLSSGCATMNSHKSQSDYQKEIEQLKAKLLENPRNLSALQALGIACYETRQYSPARKNLVKAFKMNPRAPKTLMYLGMTLEAENQNTKALKIYRRFQRITGGSVFKKTMEMRYRLLVRKMMREEMRGILKKERSLTNSIPAPNTIAVFPLTYQGADDKFAPLGKGLSEMMITDLSQIKELVLIERLRLQALFDEMALGQSGLVDKKSAPRFGKLLGAAKIVHGSYDVFDGENLQLDVAFWDVGIQAFPKFSKQAEGLENLFKLEKKMVFDLIDEMGIEITALEREKIQRIPTKNMQAFMAYCMGLENEDTEQFDAAAKYYRLALNLDPKFKQAREKLHRTRVLAPVPENKPAPENFEDKKSLILDRLNNQGSSMGASLIPGQESRKTAEEVQNAGVQVFGDLPLPPKPPGKR
ncbi:MAG: CsgG/HfaB family protein, partial [Methanosarcinaceae archaeon]